MFRTEQPLLRIHPTPNVWKVELPVVWDTPEEIIVVPPGFLTDLASIPRLLHPLIPVNGKHRTAAILHDYLFVIQDRTLAEVDALFLRAMEASGVGETLRMVMYAGVRLGSWRPWRKNARARAQNLNAFLASYGLPPAQAPGVTTNAHP